ncbi:MAG TPA: endolytic transglycosylase MltG [Candidatus Binatia bacterium]
MKSFLITLCVIFASVVLFVGVVLSYIFLGTSPRSGVVDIRIEQGEPFSMVVRKLRDQKVVSNDKLFSLWARYSGSEKKIHWGFYRFELPLSPAEVLNRMVQGKGLFQRVTIPEGLTVNEVADLLAKMGIVSEERFLAAAQDPELLASLGLEGKGVEGYLFPNTYSFIPETPAREIILQMTEQFRKSVEPLAGQKMEDNNLTPYEIVTLASMIEKETGVEAERPLISAVFHNRLKLKMPLQSDPTVIYGMKGFNGNLTRKDLHASSPYNTYRIPALPPGPICNPGLSSLRAALHPAPVPFLYFVSKNDGTHYFSDNLEAHSQAVKFYQPRNETMSARRKPAPRD